MGLRTRARSKRTLLRAIVRLAGDAVELCQSEPGRGPLRDCLLERRVSAHAARRLKGDSARPSRERESSLALMRHAFLSTLCSEPDLSFERRRALPQQWLVAISQPGRPARGAFNWINIR